jgi:hypothetical protein
MKQVIQKKSLLKRLWRRVRSKAFLGALSLAVALWMYASLNMSYTTSIKVPFSVVLPDNRAIENPLQSVISIKVKSVGWYLFNLIYFNSSARCHVDLSEKNISGDEYQISRNELLKSIQSITNAEPIDVYPESITLQLGKIGIAKVPVHLTADIQTMKEFIIVGEPKLDPDSIIISGNEKVVMNIHSWNTQPIHMNKVKNSFTVSIPLSDSLGVILKKSSRYINVTYDIQQTAEVTFNDVEVRIRGGALPSHHYLQPRLISVTVRGGVEKLASLSMDKITSYIDYYEVVNDTIGIIKPHINIPNGLILQNANPRFLYHTIRVQSFD